ncbi:hypothetical protein V7S43_005531 [Phytophthora oleae]|uniref:Uncharacterized protein n=1 Tax=Phytophthora oleae TaxID=2107226 RepID=A0ABD3FRY9_9STRA
MPLAPRYKVFTDFETTGKRRFPVKHRFSRWLRKELREDDVAVVVAVWRLQGLPPDEQPGLDAIQRAACERRKAARQKEAVESASVAESVAEDQPAAEPETQGTPVVSEAQGSQGGSSDAEVSENAVAATREGGDEVSVGGTDVVEPPKSIDLRSESPTSEKCVVEVKPEPRLADEEAPQNSKSEDAAVSEDAPMKSGDSLKTPSDDSGRADSLDGERALQYVRREFRRWRDKDPGRVIPPNVDYAWPTPKPDANVFQKAAAATGDYIKWRCSSAFAEEAWISEFHLKRYGFGLTEDLTYVEIPMNALTAPECIAVLQTMLFEAGFEFQNLIPRWSENVVSSVFESLIHSVSTELQSRLAVELVEWATVTDRLQINRLPEHRKPDTETHQENEEDVLLDHEADLRGRQLILKLRVTGLRVTHSSDGSSSGEPAQSKRSQHVPPRPQVPSTLSALSTPSLNSLSVYETRSDTTRVESGTPMSEDRSSSQTPMTDTRIPSVIGTSRASIRCLEFRHLVEVLQTL